MKGDGEVKVDSPLAILPEELIIKIFKHLDFPSKKNSRLVCKQWRRVLDDPQFDNYKFRAVVKDNVSARHLHASLLAMDHAAYENVTITVPSNKFPPILHAVLELHNTVANIFAFLKYGCAAAESLQIKLLAFEEIGRHGRRDILRITKEIDWNNLHYLELCVGDRCFCHDNTAANSTQLVKHADGIQELLILANFPNLNAIAFSFRDAAITVKTMALFSELYTFINRHATKIKSVELRMRMEANPNGSSGVGEIKDKNVRVSKPIQESLAQNLKLTSLGISNEVCDHYTLVPPCLIPSNTLANLFYNWSNVERLEGILSKNQDSLVSIRIPNHNMMTFDMNWIQNFTKLTNLSINYFDTNALINLPSLKYLNIETIVIPNEPPPNLIDYIIRCFSNLEKIKICSTSFILNATNVEDLMTLPYLQEFVCWAGCHTVDLIKIAELQSEDFVIHQGTHGNWECRSCPLHTMIGWETTIKKRSG